MTPAQEAWTQRRIGTLMKPQRSAVRSKAIRYRPSSKGNGVWFLLENDKQVYRKFPASLLSLDSLLRS